METIKQKSISLILKVALPIIISILILIKYANAIETSWFEILIISPILIIGVIYIADILAFVILCIQLLLITIILWIFDKIDERKEKKGK